MQYNKLGIAGIRVSEISFGSWITFGKQIGVAEVKTLMHAAFDHGIIFLIMPKVTRTGKLRF